MSSKSASSRGPKGLTKLYLIGYNAASLTLWATCTLRGFYLLATNSPEDIPVIFNDIFWPLLATTQTLAVLEIFHSLLGIVRAPVTTTAMQVASRLLLIWGVMFLFHEQGDGAGIVGAPTEAVKVGDYAFLGCLSAWGVTECIRYGFFALQVLGAGVPGWLTWLRYNTFYVLYPLGITSECVMVVKALEPAAEFNPLYRWFLLVVLGIYVPGSYILYTHMIAQRKKVLKKRAE
ncbi:tyrosine phosphatase-like protein [Aspergillus caelatus]|uniref:Very-long-chain (3R)-3-hydroxyacyl-CoA dehydratase n=1 Tax=Aspergillus caelatus TaxID=61420 RepID=A0A5N6ZIY2_9EURO|nr:tyrosine phosphatase-like protein [Aspergillus caelatus]KAE8357571.1 tyrosine phosphatase-like protein [Aspergillus caelatus]